MHGSSNIFVAMEATVFFDCVYWRIDVAVVVDIHDVRHSLLQKASLLEICVYIANFHKQMKSPF